MVVVEEQKIKEWFNNHMHTHTDWTGTRVETINHCDSVEKLTDEFIKFARHSYV